MARAPVGPQPSAGSPRFRGSWTEAPGGSGPVVLVTLPVRDEANRLVESLLAVKAELDASGLNYRLSVAEDGSTDGTKAVLRQLPTLIPGIVVREHSTPLGRGKALRLLWSELEADVYCFTDTDLAAGPDAVVAAVRRVLEGADIVVGSRYAPGAVVHRPPLREIVSKGYNGMLRFAFAEHIRDHQCGLKVFSARAIRQLLPESREDSWFWDTEILVLALRADIPVCEMPVHWVEKKTRRTRLARLFSDIYLHGSGMVRLRSRVGGMRSPLPDLSAPQGKPDTTARSQS
jgi:glycosyltransferase involved in cell wall biosynthesis